MYVVVDSMTSGDCGLDKVRGSEWGELMRALKIVGMFLLSFLAVDVVAVWLFGLAGISSTIPGTLVALVLGIAITAYWATNTK